MKKIIATAACFAIIACVSIAAQARVIGYTEDSENFPNMLHTKPDCGEAYQNYLNVAQPINACHHLDEAKANFAAQQKVKSEMGSMKNCSKCMVQGDFSRTIGSKTVRFSGSQFCFGVKALNNTTGKLLFSAKPVE